MVLLAILAVLAPGATARAADEPSSPLTPLQAVVDRLGEEAASFDGGAMWGLAVMDLTTGEVVEYQGDQWIKAASALKVAWMAAAISESGLAAVEPYANAVVVWSNNDTAGRVIELAGGLDRANALTSGLGMNGTLVVEWTFGTYQRSRYYPGEHPYLNYTTAHDLMTFWRWLYEGAVLDTTGTDTLLAWSRIPKAGAHRLLLERLPDGSDDWVSYKMGHLPPGRSYEDDEEGTPVIVEGARDTVLGGGIVEIPGGHTYAIGLGGFGGWSWPGKLAWVSYASCRVYEVISGDDIDCDRSGDPQRTLLDTDPPTGGLVTVSGGPEFVGVRGWAADPDDPFGSILVRFTVDGHWSGITRAAHHHAWGADPAAVRPGHGFETTLLTLLAPGEHEICAHAINDGEGPDTPVGCLTHVVE